MPAIKRYKVTRVQSVEMSSTNPLDAQKAACAYLDGEDSVSWDVGYPTAAATIKVSLSAEEL